MRSTKDFEEHTWGKRHIHNVLASRLVLEAWNIFGIRLICFSYHRTDDEQFRLYADGRSKCDGYQKKSKHQLWLAHDYCIVTDLGKWVGFGDEPMTDNEKDDYRLIGVQWEVYHPKNKWGGHFEGFHDYFHFQSF